MLLPSSPPPPLPLINIMTDLSLPSYYYHNHYHNHYLPTYLPCDPQVHPSDWYGSTHSHRFTREKGGVRVRRVEEEEEGGGGRRMEEEGRGGHEEEEEEKD